MNTNLNTDSIASIFRIERPGENWDANKRMMWEQLLRALARYAKTEDETFSETIFFQIAGGTFGLLGPDTGLTYTQTGGEKNDIGM